MKIVSYVVGNIASQDAVRIYVGGRLKPLGALSRDGSVMVTCKGIKGLLEANEYTVFKVRLGQEIPDDAKFLGTVADIGDDGVFYVVHLFIKCTTMDAKRSGDSTRDVGLQALDI